MNSHPRVASTSTELDWLIIGGGIHGVHIAARLIGEGRVASERLRILDPADRLLERWQTCTTTTSMTHLRSPSVHHLDLDPWSLQEYADTLSGRRTELFTPPYDRPSLELFDAHCDRVVKTYALEDLHIRDRAAACTVHCDGVAVRTADGFELGARTAVLAIGSSDQPEWPEWAPRDHPRIAHVFELGFNGWPSRVPEVVAVVGGGISATQVALRLADEGHQVHLIARHPLRRHQFDSDPGWLGPKFMDGFNRERDLDRRRAMILEARHRGSVPPDVRYALGQAVDKGQITRHLIEIEEVVAGCDGLRLRLSYSEWIDVERVLLATGFAPGRPGGAMVDELVASAGLPCARCGYPVVDSALRWHPRIHVSGPLAELELGPASRNIAGARRTGDRLVEA